MKRLIVCMLCILLSASTVHAEKLITPTPPPEEVGVSIPATKNWGIKDVLTRWEGQEHNQEAFEQLKDLQNIDEKTIGLETLLRIIITYCMEINADTTFSVMMDYMPVITIENDQLKAVVMTHALGFTLVLDAFDGSCLDLIIDEEDGNG